MLNLGITSPDIDTRSLKIDIKEMLDQYYDKKSKEIKLGELVNQLVEISIKYQIKMPVEFALLGKVLLIIEGIGLELDPHFNLAEIAKPYTKYKRAYSGEKKLSMSFAFNVLCQKNSPLNNILTHIGKGRTTQYIILLK